jgi:hypothetical protein
MEVAARRVHPFLPWVDRELIAGAAEARHVTEVIIGDGALGGCEAAAREAQVCDAAGKNRILDEAVGRIDAALAVAVADGIVVEGAVEDIEVER